MMSDRPGLGKEPPGNPPSFRHRLPHHGGEEDWHPTRAWSKLRPMSRLGTLACALGCALLAWTSATPAFAQATLTLKAGQEVDTNPSRVADAPADPALAARLVAAVEADTSIGERGHFGADARALGRLFYTRRDDNSLGLTLSSALSGRVAPRASLTLDVDGRARLEPQRECDDALLCAMPQNYQSLRTHGRAAWRTGPITWGAYAGPRIFAFGADPDLSWFGPGGGLTASGRIGEDVRVSTYYDATWRRYRGERARLGVNGGVYVDPGVSRRDTLHAAGAAIAWSSARWSLELSYGYLRNLSNSTAKGYSRHQIEPSITAIPVGDLLVRVSARVMRASYDVRGPLDASLNVDEEARNRVRVVLEHPIVSELLYVEAGWAFYGQAFAGRNGVDGERAEGRFRRQVAHLGLTVRLPREE